MPLKIKDIGEFEMIRRLAGGISGTELKVIKGIGDDTAVLPFKRSQHYLFTTDMLVEGVHFKAKSGAVRIGHKALAVNISDIAAMGGRPLYAVISLGLKSTTAVNFVRNLYQGINRLAKRFNVAIVGGDTVRSKQLTVSIALIGEVAARKLVLRSGAKAGDILCVSGPLGRAWQNGKDMKFIPRVEWMQQLIGAGCKPSAAIDISDGLLSDLNHLLKASGVGATLHKDLIPKTKGATWQQACTDGEDFEILFTMSKAKYRQLRKQHDLLNSCHEIGQITRSGGRLQLVDQNGEKIPLPKNGYQHF